MIFQKSLQVFLTIFAEEEAVDLGAQLLEREV